MSTRNRRRAADDAERTEQWLAGLRTGDHDGRTVPYAGTSDLGVMPGPDTQPFTAENVAEIGRRAWDQRPAARPPARDALGFQETRLHADCDPAPQAEATARGWPHLFTIRCGYPAAGHHTPIPCGAAHRDPAMGTFRRLRLSAQAAGWHLDAWGRWACPGCQMSSDYRTLYPVAIWAYEQTDPGTVGAAEHDILRDVLDAARRGRHQAVTR
jgi:hypothetical protein